MIPISGWILVAAAALTGPALWSALVTGSMPIDVALTRFLLVTAGCWVAASVASGLLDTVEPERVARDEDPHRPPEG